MLGSHDLYQNTVLTSAIVRCVVGTDAYKAIMDKLEKYKENYTKYEKLSNSTDVDGYER